MNVDGAVSAETSIPSHCCLWDRKRSLKRYSMDTETPKREQSFLPYADEGSIPPAPVG